MADTDLTIAYDTLAGSASAIMQLVAQAAVGDPAAIDNLRRELAIARDYRAYYVANVSGVDTAMIDHAIAAGERIVGGGTSGGTIGAGLFTPQGLKIGNVVIPWVAVGVALLLLYLALRKGKR